ncbi:DUF5677 domain-containing protein [Bacillus thuringiensis]|uniref:DUF5677 domain-containing protein n=1 Tax=Bacillus thuringiensis TaxID=1428 RepID=UPI000C01634A|nr:DUF5677 domain-containing protein [Bacillus thuringiensis]PFU70354.1 hypothetical protein COK95_09625 [Bacillus thuringiensis]
MKEADFVMKPYEVLNETIKFANKQLNDYKQSSDFKNAAESNDVSTVVITALYRKIIELCEGVRVSGANGLKGPATLNYRGLLEAWLALKFIVQDDSLLENRAKVYKIGYHKQQIEAVKQAKSNGWITDQRRESLDNAIKYHKEQLEIEELQDALDEYNKLQASDKRGYLPNWHALYKGEKSINALAKKLSSEDNLDKNLMATLYSFLSVDSHNYMALSAISKEGENLTIKPIRAKFDCNIDEYNFIGTRSLLLSAIEIFTNLKYPDYNELKRSFLIHIKPHLNYN